MAKSVYGVVTTIQQPTDCIRKLADRLRKEGGELLIVGDRKGPFSYDQEGTLFFPIDDQTKLPFTLAEILPENNYMRKNLGYLVAMQSSAPCIYETDDDNMPGTLWTMRSETVNAAEVSGMPWLNIFRSYTDEHIWPRGFPLEMLTDGATVNAAESKTSDVSSPIQIGISDNAPDVDALWRLVFNRPVTFRPGQNLWLKPGTWCPFNSQDTWWFPAAYPLMYLPSTCTFRMCDIWRGFVAQKCLWAMGKGIAFVGPTTVQDRNQHNLMHDFRDELPGYVGNLKLVAALESLTLDAAPESVPRNMRACYETMVDAGYLKPEELPMLDAWLNDVASLAR